MKKLIYLSLISLSSLTYAQVVIGNGSTTATNSSVSLEFTNDEAKGIVLPYVKEADATANVDGALIMDPNDKQVKLRKSGSWVSLSGDASTTSAVSTTIQDSKTEQTDAKVGIGEATATDGVLVLEDTDKAMILPKVANPHKNIKNPAPGMVVFDSANQQLAVFNGTQWSFWSAE